VSAAPSLSRRLAAEAIGTALLLATVVGSGIMAERLAGGNDAIALLGNTLATGAILVVLINALAPVSGAHFNPAVTLSFLLQRKIAPRVALLYVLVQCAAAIAGVALAHLMFEKPPLEIGIKPRASPALWLAEAVATAGLIGTIMGTVRFRPEAVASAVGLYITAAYWFTASTSFANPAVAIARALTDTFAGIRPVDLPGFIAAEFFGALIAMALAGWLLAEPKPVAHMKAAE
jgi:glycerol uptake facilitator-like aquaporin